MGPQIFFGWYAYVYGISVHKILLQFLKFITKAVDEISYTDLFYINQCLLKLLFKLKFCVSN